MTDYESAREVALKYLDFQARTSTEVRRRLQKARYTEEVIDSVVGDLEQAGLLNDSRFSSDWVESRSRRKGFGRRRLAAELRQKGIAAEEVQQAIDQIEPESEIDAAISLVLKRATPQSLADESAKRRLAGYLQRRGYNWETIEQVFARIEANTQ